MHSVKCGLLLSKFHVVLCVCLLDLTKTAEQMGDALSLWDMDLWEPKNHGTSIFWRHIWS